MSRDEMDQLEAKLNKAKCLTASIKDIKNFREIIFDSITPTQVKFSIGSSYIRKTLYDDEINILLTLLDACIARHEKELEEL